MNKVFDAITCSTEDIKEFYKPYNPRISVLPNNLDLKWFDSFPQIKKDDGFVRIGFLASASHLEGIYIIKKPLQAIIEKYPNVKISVMAMYRNQFLDFPQERMEYVEWIPLEQWPKGLKEIGLDIALAPLADNYFNRSKSNLRWLEHCACRLPIVVSPIKPYLSVKNGIDGLFAKENDEWYDAMKRLIEDEQLRITIGKNGYQRINREFDIDKNIGHWETVYRQTHDHYRNFYGSKKQFRKISKNRWQEIISARKVRR